MIKLNPNSWFIRKYLGIKSDHDLPSGVCELLAQTFFTTCMFLIIAGLIVGVAASMILATYFGFDVDAISTYLVSNDNSFPAHAIIGFGAVGYVYSTIFLVNFFFGNKIATWRREREVQFNAEYVSKCIDLSSKTISREEFDAWFEKSKYNKDAWYETMFQFIGAIYTRITEKTCVMIDWQKKDR